MNPIFDKLDLGRRVICLFMGVLAGSGAMAAQTPPVFQDGRVSVHVVRTAEALVIDLTTLATPGLVRVALGSAVTQVRSMQRAGDKLIVMGDLGAGGAAEVSLIDLQTQRLYDRFWAIRPSPSPDGRFIAFVRFYPLSGVSGHESQYRVYRLGSSPAENRIEFADIKPGDIAPSDLQDVGFALYPTYAGKAAPDNIGVSERLAHRHGSDLFWSADSNAVGFVDTQGGNASTVLVTFAADASVARIRTAGLSLPAHLCMAGSMVKGCRPVATESVRLSFEGARVTVRVNILGDGPDKQARVIDVPMKSFVTSE